jgi:hypothetical protein
VSNQDDTGRPQDPEHRPEDYLHTNPDGSQTPRYPGQPDDERRDVPPNPYGSAETSSYGTPPTHTPYGEPPTQPYAAQPPAYGQDPYAAPYGSYGQPGQYGGYGAGHAPQQHPSATTALVLGLVSLIGMFVCVFPILAAPFAWRTGGRAVKEIDAQPGRWSGREQAQAGRIMGIIGTVLLVLGIIAMIGLFALLFATAGEVSSPTGVDGTTDGQGF